MSNWHHEDDIRLLYQQESEITTLKEQLEQAKDIAAGLSDRLADSDKKLVAANNASWMSHVHMLCTDIGIEPGHIDYRTEQLVKKVHDLQEQLAMEIESSARNDAIAFDTIHGLQTKLAEAKASVRDMIDKAHHNSLLDIAKYEAYSKGRQEGRSEAAREIEYLTAELKHAKSQRDDYKELYYQELEDRIV